MHWVIICSQQLLTSFCYAGSVQSTVGKAVNKTDAVLQFIEVHSKGELEEEF